MAKKIKTAKFKDPQEFYRQAALDSLKRIRSSDWKDQHTGLNLSQVAALIWTAAKDQTAITAQVKETYKKAGIILSGFVPDNALQTSLFAPAQTSKQKKLMNVIDNMNAAYRNDILKFGASGTQKNWKMRSEKRSKRYTTRWEELCLVK